MQVGSKSLFVDDEVIEALIDDAIHVARMRADDRLDLRGHSEEGDRITTPCPLNGGTDLVADTTNPPVEDVDDSEAIAYLQGREA